MQADERREGFLFRHSEPNSPTVERDAWLGEVGKDEDLGGIRHKMVDDDWEWRSEAQ
jgi:hypothetical protein